MKMQRIFLLIYTILFTVIFSGCNNNSSDNTLNSSVSTPSHIKQILDTNLEVNADVTAPTSTSYPTYIANIYEPTISQVKTAFFNEIQENELEIQRHTKEIDGEYGFQVKYQNQMFYYSGIQIYINYDYYNYFQLISYYPDTLYELPLNFKLAGIEDAGNLSFKTRDEALNEVKRAATKLGLYLEDEPFTCIALTADSLDHLYNYIEGTPEQFNSEENISFENDDGCYYIVWNQKTENGESILSENFSAQTLSGVENFRGAYISAIVNKENIVAFNTTVNYENIKKNKEVKIISLNTALNTIKEKYHNIILNEPVIIKKIRFCYSYTLIDKDSLTYEAIPTWSILSYDTADDSYSLTIVNAITGKLL